MALTKNIGQVSGLFIGTQPPSNRTLIWFDSTPAIRAHKVYNTALSAWVMLDNTVISNITYSELAGIASGAGLTQGAWYKITDRGNALALAITSTKIQYVDLNGNFIIDDLVASAIYVVNSNNLYIDDQQGVWDAQNHQLKFNFTQVTPDADSGTDFVYGRRTRLGVTTFIKYTMQSLVSAVTGNSITWNQGLYFNFLSELNSQMDVEGGVVSKRYFDTNFMQMQISYNNLADSINDMYTDIQTMVQNLTTNQAIFDKQMPYQMVPGTAAEILTGDTLGDIVQKCQRWFDQLRYSTGIEVGPNFTPAANESSINSADDVFEALRKLQKAMNNRVNEIFAINQFRSAYQHQGLAIVHFSKRGTTAITTGTVRFGVCIANVKMMDVGSASEFISNSGASGHVFAYSNPTSVVGVVFNPGGIAESTEYQVTTPMIKYPTTTIWVQVMVAADATSTNLSWALGRSGVIMFGTNMAPYLSNETPNSGIINPFGAALINLKYVGVPSSLFANANRNVVIDLSLTTE